MKANNLEGYFKIIIKGLVITNLNRTIRILSFEVSDLDAYTIEIAAIIGFLRS